MDTKNVRCPGKGFNLDHNIWNNNGTWFVHYTIYPTPITKVRVRRSLNTKSVEEARQRRDELLRRLADANQLACLPVALLAA